MDFRLDSQGLAGASIAPNALVLFRLAMVGVDAGQKDEIDNLGKVSIASCTRS